MSQGKAVSVGSRILWLLILVGSSFFSCWLVAYAQSSHSAKAHPNAKPAGDQNTYVLVGAGDIAGCSNLAGAQATARLIDGIPGTVFAAGDLAYENGTYAEFQRCYQPTWGRFRDRTRPSPGNHEYPSERSVASGYFQYWGLQAGDPTKGYYSFDLGAWHIISLNTNCDVRELGGCAPGSAEETWLLQDLAARPDACILAYGHHALFSSGIIGPHARHRDLEPFWQDLYAAHADLMISAHEHSYERFAPRIRKVNSIPSAAYARLSWVQAGAATRPSASRNRTAKSGTTRPTEC